MGNSLSSWFKSLFGGVKMRVLLLGLDAAGKTTILQALKLGHATPTTPTIGFNVETVRFQSLELNIWDVGGQDKLRPFWRHYYSGTSGVIFVVDSSDRERMSKVKGELHAIMQENELEFASLLVLANKQDMKEALKPDEVATALELDALKPRLCHVMPSVATENSGLQEALQWLHDNMKPL